MYRGGCSDGNRWTSPLYFDRDCLLIALIFILLTVHEASVSLESLRLCLAVRMRFAEETGVAIIAILVFFIISYHVWIRFICNLLQGARALSSRPDNGVPAVPRIVRGWTRNG